jgi:hypothetical protein
MYIPQPPSRAPITDSARVSPAQRNPIPRARITTRPPPPRDSSHSPPDSSSDDECTSRAQEHSATGTPSTNPRPPLSYRHTRLFRIQRLYCARILHLMFSQSCFLEVDRVYAVLGLFPPGLMAKVDVNYSRDHRDEYWATYLQFCQGLLSCLGRRNGPVVDALRGIAQRARKCPGDAPLWCPDFSRPLHAPAENTRWAKEAEERGW